MLPIRKVTQIRTVVEIVHIEQLLHCAQYISTPVTPLSSRLPRRHSMENNSLKRPIVRYRKDSTSTSSSSDDENLSVLINNENVQPTAGPPAKKSRIELIKEIPAFPKKANETLSNAAFLSKIRSDEKYRILSKLMIITLIYLKCHWMICMIQENMISKRWIPCMFKNCKTRSLIIH
uniref:Uncharacterized protein n=1 Tax=Romanomermis culicivorax TaxID=13658 RepID=A0A915IEK9_ROMCU